jgi:hypothetical protein
MNTGPHGIWYLILLLPLLAVLGWFYYRITVPDIAPARRIVLLVLRVLGLAALALALARPVFDWNSAAQLPPAWARLVDYSGSMDRTDGLESNETRLLSAQRILHSENWNSFPVRMSTSYFADSLADDTTGLNRAGTDLYNALHLLASRPDPPSMVFVLSDGASNAAQDPSEGKWPFRVFSLCIGDSSQSSDRALVSIDAPAVATAGDSVHVTLRMTSSGEATKSLLTFSAGKTQTNRTVDLVGQGRQQETSFSFVPDEAGVYRVRAELATSEDEPVEANNQIEARVFVEPRKRRVALLATEPNWETGFLNRRLRRDDRLEVVTSYYSLSGKGGYASWPAVYDSLAKFDLVVLADMPPVQWLKLSTLLDRFLRERAGGVLFLLGPKAASGDWSELQQSLIQIRWGARPPGVLSTSDAVFLTAEGQFHPATKLDTTAAAAATIWAELPLLTGLLPGATPPGVASLVETKLGLQTWTVLAAGRVGRGRVATILGYPTWRWDFAAAAIPHDVSWAQLFWRTAVRWLTLGGEAEQLVVRPTTDPVPALSPVELSATLVDESWRPVGNASLTAEIRDSAGTIVQTFDFERGEPGQYRGAGRPLSPGDYNYTVRARVDTLIMAEATGQFSASAVSREAMFTASRPDLLDRLVASSGGKRLSADNWASELAEVPTAPVERISYGSFRLWESPWLLGAILVFLSLEWILRRRYQML